MDLFSSLVRGRPKVAPIAAPQPRKRLPTLEVGTGTSGGERLFAKDDGFWLVSSDDKRKHASCASVFALLKRSTDVTVAAAFASKASALHELEMELEQGRAEGEVARALVALLGPTVELAIASAIGASSGALQRAQKRRASKASKDAAANSAPTAGGEPPGPHRALSRKRSSRRDVAAAPYAQSSSQPSLGTRRSSARLQQHHQQQQQQQAASSSHTGLTSMMGGPSLSFEEDDDDEDPKVAKANAKFKGKDPAQRAAALLERAARRDEAAQVMQATWRMKADKKDAEEAGAVAKANEKFKQKDPAQRAAALLERAARRDEAAQVMQTTWRMRGDR